MNLQNKIEEIRRKPEHIRLRYVWALSAISLLIVIILWIFSIKSQEDNSPASFPDGGQENIFDQFNEQKQSLQNTTGQMKDAFK